jgi:hypothetical protein
VAHTFSECAYPTDDPATAAVFERDLIALLEPLQRQALRITSHPADAEDLLQANGSQRLCRCALIPGRDEPQRLATPDHDRHIHQ